MLDDLGLVELSFQRYKSAQNKDMPMFIAKDVAEALGYTNTVDAVARHCKKAIEAGSIEKQRETRSLHPQVNLSLSLTSTAWCSAPSWRTPRSSKTG